MTPPTKKSHPGNKQVDELGERLRGLFDSGSRVGIPSEASKTLEPYIQGNQKTVPAAMLWALGVECLSEAEPRSILESSPHWIPKVRAPKGMKAPDVTKLVESVRAVDGKGMRGAEALGWLAVCAPTPLASVAWKTALEEDLALSIVKVLKQRSLAAKETDRQTKFMSQGLKAWRRKREITSSAAQIAELQLTLQSGDLPRTPPAWFDELIQFADLNWLGRFFAGLATKGSTDWRTRLIEWLDQSQAFGVTLKFLTGLLPQGSSPTADEIGLILGSWPADRAELLLRELIRASSKDVVPEFAVTLAAVATNPPPGIPEEKRAEITAALDTAIASPPYSQETRNRVLETLGRTVQATTHESFDLLLKIAADRGLPAEQRLEAATKLLDADPGAYRRVGRAVADLTEMATSGLLQLIESSAAKICAENGTTEPLMHLMIELRDNSQALEAFLGWCSESEHADELAESLVSTWEEASTEREVIEPAPLASSEGIRDLLAKKLAKRLGQVAEASRETRLLDRLAVLLPESKSLAIVLTEAFKNHVQDAQGAVNQRVDALKKQLDTDQQRLRSAAKRDREQLFIDLLPVASAVWLAVKSGAKEDLESSVSTAWAFVVDFYGKHRYRLFPEEVVVPFDPAVHEYRGDCNTLGPGTECRVVSLGLEQESEGHWIRICSAVVV